MIKKKIEKNIYRTKNKYKVIEKKNLSYFVFNFEFLYAAT